MGSDMTAIATAPASPSPELITLDNVSWELYEALLRETEEQHIRITYDGGRMVLMSPLPRHDKVKKLLGRMIEVASLELDIPISSFGSTTWKRKDLGKGLEADECYYVQNELQVRGRDDIDLANDPPPDLAVEVEITHHPLDRKPIYAALGVFEIWRFDGSRVQFLRKSGGDYNVVERSEAIPALTSEDVNHFLEAFAGNNETAVVRQFREWLLAKR
jgi:Uma2 family endonuclease